MSELSPRAREVLRSGRGLNRPTDADRERVRSALQERMSAALVLAEGNKALPMPRPRWPFVTSVIVGAGLIAGTAFLASRHQPAMERLPHALVAPVA